MHELAFSYPFFRFIVIIYFYCTKLYINLHVDQNAFTAALKYLHKTFYNSYNCQLNCWTKIFSFLLENFGPRSNTI